MLKYFNFNKLFLLLEYLFFSILISSCQLITFEELKISSNIDEDNIYFNDDKIRLNFSEQIDYESLKTILVLKQDNSSIEYNSTKTENLVTLFPKSDWSKNSSYKVSIIGELKTQSGKYYQVDFQKYFTYGKQNDFFELISFYNPQNNFPEQNSLILKFNKEIDISSFENNFSLLPFIKTKKIFSDDNKKVTITPEEKWQANTVFTWTISNLKSKDNYLLQKEYTDSFFPEEDLILPELISVKPVQIINATTNNFIYKDNISDIFIADSLAFTFNKKINLSTFTNNFQITPATSANFMQHENTIIFIPTNNFKIQTEYKININSNVKDLNDLHLSKDFFTSFICKNDYLNITSCNANQNLNLLLKPTFLNSDRFAKINYSDFQKLFIQLNFSKPISQGSISTIDKIIQIEPFLQTSSSIPKLEKISWNSEYDSVIFEYTNFSFDKNLDKLYQLKINSSKSLCTSRDNEYLKEDLCTFFSLY